MRRLVMICAVSVLALFAVGCKASPEKVCKHIRSLGADATSDCVSEMRGVEEAHPQYWSDIGACFLAARATDELGTCYEVMDTIQLQDFCRAMMERVPDAYSGSISKCLREQRALMRSDKAIWERRAQCLENADSAEAVRACRLAVPKPSAE